MAKYSRIYKVGSRKFRYNYERSVLECIVTVTKDMEHDNAEWIKDIGKPLWDIVDGYALMDSIGLNVDNWKENPRYWCEQYDYELSEELYYEAKMFEREMKYYKEV